MSLDHTADVAEANEVYRDPYGHNPEADARAITEALGGTWHESGPGFVPAHGRAPCPVCQPERRPDQSALYIEYRGGCVPLFCDSGGCTIPEIVEALRRSGVVTGVRELGYYREGSDLLEQIEWFEERSRRHRRAKHIWEGSRAIQGTPAEARLRKMGITCALPDTLRFHPNCWHPDGTRRPAMVALLNREFWNPDGVHITYLPPEGSGDDTQVTEVLLGEPGQAVTIVDHPYRAMAPIVVVDTIASALALTSGLLDGRARIWAALSPEGMEKLRLPEHRVGVDESILCYPQLPARLLVVRNGGAESRRAAEALAERAYSSNWDVEFLTTDWEQTLVDMLGDKYGPDWKIPPADAPTSSDVGKEEAAAKLAPESTGGQEADPTPVPSSEPDLSDDTEGAIPF